MRLLRTHDGLSLKLWQSAPERKARGSVLIVHGLGEHIHRYGHVAAHLNACGWYALGYDQRGHGVSGGARGTLNNDDDLLRDLARVIDEARESAPGPLVLLGHSMGGLVAARFVAEELSETPARWWRKVDALVMSSPALEVHTSGLRDGLLALLCKLAPRASLRNGLEAAWISRDPEVVQAYEIDPLVHDRLTPRLARFILDSGTFVRERAARWRTPTLLMWAGADRCVAPRGSAAFAAAAPSTVVRTREWAGLYHEIFNEPEKAEVLFELGRWLEACGPRPVDVASGDA